MQKWSTKTATKRKKEKEHINENKDSNLGKTHLQERK